MKNDCAGLRGAKAIGDQRVSSLAQFSWKNRHQSGQHAMTVLDEIGNERARQVGIEGFGPAHDDYHTQGEIARAAAAYALAASYIDYDRDHRNFLGEWWGGEHSPVRRLWPWEWSWFKPKDKRRDMVRAGALIVAEIERMDRAALSAADGAKP